MATLDTALPVSSAILSSTFNGLTEVTTTIVIGSGFSGLVMAAELNRKGIQTIVLDGFRPVSGTAQDPALATVSGALHGSSSAAPVTGGISLEAMAERTDILRLLEHYARRHDLDIRSSSYATALLRTQPTGPAGRPWSVQTPTGMLSAHSIVFTRGALNQLRRTLRKLGVASGYEFTAAMHSLGIYLVGVGELVLPTTQEILHQARRAGQSIAARMEIRAALTATA